MSEEEARAKAALDLLDQDDDMEDATGGASLRAGKTGTGSATGTDMLRRMFNNMANVSPAANLSGPDPPLVACVNGFPFAYDRVRAARQNSSKITQLGTLGGFKLLNLNGVGVGETGSFVVGGDQRLLGVQLIHDLEKKNQCYNNSGSWQPLLSGLR